MAAAKKTTRKKATVKKTATKKAATKKAVVQKPAIKKTAAKKATPKKSAAPTPAAAKKVPVKKPAAKRIVKKKPSPTRSSLLSNDVPEVHEIPAPRGTTKDGIAYTKDFDVKFLKVQREELLARRASEIRRATRLEDEAESLIEDGEMGDVQFDDEGGEGDGMVVQRDLDRVISSQSRQTVEEIDLALARIEVGTYGYSEVSGQPIPRERLEALPETTVLAVEKVSGAGLR
jgi:RNA polymerase-binding transcription factor DksA